MVDWHGSYRAWRERFAIDQAAWAGLSDYMQLLRDAPMNLTALRGVALQEKGVLNSLEVLAASDDWESAMDIGSGSGLPGMVLAIARPGRKMTLVESRHKRADFLKRAVDLLHLERVSVLSSRAETLLSQDMGHREQYDLVTLRAVGNFRVSAELGLPAVRVGGKLVLLRGPLAIEECQAFAPWVVELGGRIEALHPVSLPSWPLDVGYMVEMVKVHRSPSAYPRARRLGD